MEESFQWENYVLVIGILLAMLAVVTGLVDQKKKKDGVDEDASPIYGTRDVFGLPKSTSNPVQEEEMDPVPSMRNPNILTFLIIILLISMLLSLGINTFI